MNNTISRRKFLKIGSLLAATTAMPKFYARTFAAGLEQMAKGAPRVLWLQAQSCSGCSVSLLNTDNPYLVEVVTDLISLVFHQTVSAAQGSTAMELLDKMSTSSDPFILVVEGSIPSGMPEACVIGGRKFTDILSKLIPKALFVVGAGTCATYGGIPAAEGNQTGAVSLMEYMEKEKIRTEGFLVNCPSCPVHPDSIVGTLAYLAARGYPPVMPKLLTPKMFYAHSTHDDCPRFHYYSKRIFAEKFGDPEGCLFKLGCLGMLSFTECPRRQWNSGVNWCIRAGAPCIGCSHHQFARMKSFPFYRKGEATHAVQYAEGDREGAKR